MNKARAIGCPGTPLGFGVSLGRPRTSPDKTGQLYRTGSPFQSDRLVINSENGQGVLARMMRHIVQTNVVAGIGQQIAVWSILLGVLMN